MGISGERSRVDAVHSRRRWLALIVPACVFVIFGVESSSAGATTLGPNLLINGDFETPVITQAFVRIPDGATGLPGWTTQNGGVEVMRSLWQPEHGSQSVDLSNYGASLISQTVTTIPGASYLLSWYIAGNPGCTATNVRGLTVLWNLQTVATSTFVQDGHTDAAMGWRQESVTVTAPGPGTTTYVRFARDVSAGGCGVAIDNTSLQLENAPTISPGAITGGGGGGRAGHSGTSTPAT